MENAETCLGDAKWGMEGERYVTVVNRSYYAIFNSIRALLIEEFIFVKTHQGTHRKFHELYIKTGLSPVEYSQILTLSAEWRQEGDYDIDAVITEGIAVMALEKAEQFLGKVKNYLV